MTLHSRNEWGRRLWQCDHCKQVAAWDEGWAAYASILDMDIIAPEDLVTTCSDTCRGAFEDAIKSGAVTVPKAQARGYEVTIKGERSGY